MALSTSTKAMLAGITGTALQWYDFAIFGYFAPIIAATYFPESSQFTALLSTFGIFAVGYLLSPLGSLIFGYIGDRYGRKRALTLSILAMAIPSALISITPGYKAIGFVAPVLITLFRMMQGFVANAEIVGSAIFLVEYAHPKRRAFYGCLTSSAYSIGLIVAGLMASLLTASFMPEWAWRVGFALALIAGLLIFYFRTHLDDTPEFQQMTPNDKLKSPFKVAIQEAPLAVIGVMGLAWLVSIMTFGTYVFTVSYLHNFFHLSLSHVTLIITLALAIDAIFEPFIALLADRMGYLPVIKTGMVAMMLLSVPVFYLLASGTILKITAGLMIMSVLVAITYAPLNAYMVLLFPKEYRYSGFGVAFILGISLFGGTTPLVMMWLIHQTGNFIAPAWYYVMGTIIGLFSLHICERSRNRVKQFTHLPSY